MVNLISDQMQRSNSYADDDFTRFFVVGDFGDLDNLSGVDNMTNIMSELASEKPFHFVTTVGDNFYPKGIETMDDLQNANKVMSYFQKADIKDIKIYPTLGNHDCYSDYTNEVKFSEFNSQWRMESDYYELKEPLKDDPSKYVVILMSNSCLLMCWNINEADQKAHKTCNKMHTEVGSQRVKEHYFWLEHKLQTYSTDPNAVWVGVAMHHPVLKEVPLKNDLLPLLQKYKVDFALVGHAHIYEYSNFGYDESLRYPNEAKGPMLDDCGADIEIYNTANLEHYFKKGEMFHQILVGTSGTELDKICPYHDQDGEVYFQSIDGHGLVTIEANSDFLRIAFYKDMEVPFFLVEISV
ncbi:unnamed protein product [Moneuplotes crassus]|uniref:Calcineurin-like phosphoesterase domain-containing protein n=1 Tax=Euplotes crassus TaxID=5936 RepID=A0AAD2CVL3_EUPCR|nr:unnamed protein product [Moneuplotes crassus]